jgi:hypothetical protein
MPRAANTTAITAVEEALATVAPTAEEQVEVMETCLELIDAQLPRSGHGGPEGGTAEQTRWAWTLRRLRALQHHERVGTTKVVCRG